jgi:polyhydroxyalkanoate synthesis regulator phasin
MPKDSLEAEVEELRKEVDALRKKVRNLEIEVEYLLRQETAGRLGK